MWAVHGFPLLKQLLEQNKDVLGCRRPLGGRGPCLPQVRCASISSSKVPSAPFTEEFMRGRLLIPCVLLSSLISAGSRIASASYAQTSFQIGGYMFTSSPADTGRLNRINNAGIDWIYDFGDMGGTLAYAQTVTGRLDALSAQSQFKLKFVANYYDPTSDAGR